ncbi:MAG: hypothetical protein ABJ205_13300 [Erythrobacter sp.]|uniref:hypothetical protein n=1 Tax=Erythrobacter sp. TaxID=1042 RepID=UPI003264F40C
MAAKVMFASANPSFASLAFLAGTGGDAVFGVQAPVQTSGDFLRGFLGNETLLWGCMAMALIALFTVAKVASRRRKAGKASRMARARADAVHSFLETVRAGHGAVQQGMWHFDFASGAQQYSDDLRTMLSSNGQNFAADEQIVETLAKAGINLAKIARDRFEEIEPYEATFTLESEGGPNRQMTLRACNFRGVNGKVQRVVAIISEA